MDMCSSKVHLDYRATARVYFKHYRLFETLYPLGKRTGDNAIEIRIAPHFKVKEPIHLGLPRALHGHTDHQAAQRRTDHDGLPHKMSVLLAVPAFIAKPVLDDKRRLATPASRGKFKFFLEMPRWTLQKHHGLLSI